MEDTPDVNVIITLNIKYEVGITSHDVTAQPWKAEYIGVTGRSGGGMVCNGAVRGLQCIDEPDGNVGCSFANVVVNCRFDIPSCCFAWSDGLLAHLRLI